MKLSILCPVYNNLDFTRQVIKSIEKNIFTDDYEIIIFNNWSTDKTKEYFFSLFCSWISHRVICINNEENIYCNPAWNELSKCANWEYLLFLNNDITLFQDFDLKLIANHTEWKIVCPFTKQYWNNEPAYYQKSNINGTCFLVKKEDYVEIPNEIKLWYGDDILFRTLWVNWINEYVMHWWSQTLNKLPELNTILENDAKEYVKYCLQKWWIDNRFQETHNY